MFIHDEVMMTGIYWLGCGCSDLIITETERKVRYIGFCDILDSQALGYADFTKLSYLFLGDKRG